MARSCRRASVLVTCALLVFGIRGASRAAHAQAAKTSDAPDTSNAPPTWVLTTPLRIDLEQDRGLFARALPDSCGSLPDPAARRFGAPPPGSSIELVPRLTLHRLARYGCALDSAAATGLTAWTSLGRRVWLVATAGVIALPSSSAALMQRPVLSPAARVDVVVQTGATSTVTVGVGTGGLRLGGMF